MTDVLTLNCGAFEQIVFDEMLEIDGGRVTSSQIVSGFMAGALLAGCVVLTLNPVTFAAGMGAFAMCSGQIVSLATTAIYG